MVQETFAPLSYTFNRAMGFDHTKKVLDLNVACDYKLANWKIDTIQIKKTAGSQTATFQFRTTGWVMNASPVMTGIPLTSMGGLLNAMAARRSPTQRELLDFFNRVVDSETEEGQFWKIGARGCFIKP